MSESKFGALAAVMARNIEDIPDLPDYKAPWPGVYQLLIESVKEDTINDKTALVVTYMIAGVVEYGSEPDPEEDKDQIVKEGDKFSEAFWFNDPEKIENTLSVLKKKFAGLAAAVGSTNLSEIMEKAEGMLVQCIISNRVDKEAAKRGEKKIYAQTRDMIPAAEAPVHETQHAVET